MKRKSFLKRMTMGVGGWLVVPTLLKRQQAATTNLCKGDPLPADKVNDFVIAGYSNADKVKSLLAEFPTLLYTSWDWSVGDFETAPEGAGHVGNKEIANYFIGLGARINLFVLTMLGKTHVVKSYLDTFPQYLKARSPHGFTLLHHVQ